MIQALNLFWIFFKVGLFCFGGGNAMIGVFEKLLVADYGYIDTRQFADMVAVSQITPGPVAINLATYVGAVLGNNIVESVYYSFWATLGISLPSFILVLSSAKFFEQFGASHSVKKIMLGIRPAVIGLIAGSVLLLCRFSIYDESKLHSEGILGSLNYKALLIALAAFFVAGKTKINPVAILIIGGAIGIIVF